MIVQIAPDPRQFRRDSHSMGRQIIPVPDAGNHQQVRGLKRPSRQHHFARMAHNFILPPHQFDAGGAAMFDHHARNLCACHHRQILPLQGRFEIGRRRTPPPPPPDRCFRRAEPQALRPVDILVIWVPRFHRCRQKGAGERMLNLHALHMQRSARAMVGIASAIVIFRAFEIGQHFAVAPPGIAHGRPAVVIRRSTAAIEHAIGRA